MYEPKEFPGMRADCLERCPHLLRCLDEHFEAVLVEDFSDDILRSDDPVGLFHELTDEPLDLGSDEQLSEVIKSIMEIYIDVKLPSVRQEARDEQLGTARTVAYLGEVCVDGPVPILNEDGRATYDCSITPSSPEQVA